MENITVSGLEFFYVKKSVGHTTANEQLKRHHCASSDNLVLINPVAKGEKVIQFHRAILKKQFYMIKKSKDLALAAWLSG